MSVVSTISHPQELLYAVEGYDKDGFKSTPADAGKDDPSWTKVTASPAAVPVQSGTGGANSKPSGPAMGIVQSRVRELEEGECNE